MSWGAEKVVFAIEDLNLRPKGVSWLSSKLSSGRVPLCVCVPAIIHSNGFSNAIYVAHGNESKLSATELPLKLQSTQQHTE